VCGLDNPGSTDIESVIAACKDVNVHDLIKSLEGGYDTPVNGGNLPLNSEERRRFALVTAIVGKCGVLVLDGAISALKSETVQERQEVVKRASEGRTVVILE
jgi:ABC-type multidrug transport system fused ATPase/permease subunit